MQQSEEDTLTFVSKIKTPFSMCWGAYYTNMSFKKPPLNSLYFLSLFSLLCAAFEGSFPPVTDSLWSANFTRKGYQCKKSITGLEVFIARRPTPKRLTLLLLYFGRVKVVIIFWVLLIFLCFNKCHDSHHSFTNHSY